MAYGIYPQQHYFYSNIYLVCGWCQLSGTASSSVVVVFGAETIEDVTIVFKVDVV